MRAASMLSPLERHATDDHQIAVDDRRHGPAAVCGEQSEVFAERSLPQNFSVFTETEKIATDAKRVDISSGWISDRRRPADAMWRNVAKVNVEAMFPEQLAGISVEAHQ